MRCDIARDFQCVVLLCRGQIAATADLCQPHAADRILKRTVTGLDETRRVLANQFARCNRRPAFQPLRADIREAIRTANSITQRDRNDSVMLARLNQRWQLDMVVAFARLDANEIAVGEREFFSGRGRDANVVIPRDLRRGIGKLLQPRIMGVTTVSQADLGVEREREVITNWSGIDQRNRIGMKLADTRSRYIRFDKAVMYRFVPECLERLRRDTRQDVCPPVCMENGIGRIAIASPAREAFQNRTCSAERRDRRLRQTHQPGDRLGVHPRLERMMIGADEVSERREIVFALRKADDQLCLANTSRQRFAVGQVVRQVRSRDEQCRDLPRLQFLDEFKNFSVVPLTLSAGAFDVDGVSIAAQQMVDEVYQYLDRHILRIAQHDACAAGVPQLLCQFVQIMLGNR